ncbi:MAG: SDR family oxidoreductase [Nitrosopumilaceae archaeon]|nr:SDR family oxidoreductase [Nitrosopumilaceae archaeon]NIU01411.1 SDR family oxidoreductase [Nitrosopumilaceae archaeon]NIU87769.1 SDR family oxidoreductase [Nitrosopumilaceae archaeon]NIV66147.1 SDR family oxidoreductase [Nitrosopumilaceae archaeon]NIX62013.1 SDR family oxidoreductase [Nitrosopumilaceae archaeon]
MKAIVCGGSRGIGAAIAESLGSIGCDVTATSKKDMDTSDLGSIDRFAQNHYNTDILVLNTGGPPPKTFYEATDDDWQKYHKQLFLGFCKILKKISINNDGYIFLISSGVIKEPTNPKLIISSAYRAAFAEVFKILSKDFAERNISCINIAPGPTDTDRMKQLVGDERKLEQIKESLPMKRFGTPKEIGNFVKGIVENKIKYLSGVTINFDGAASNYVF